MGLHRFCPVPSGRMGTLWTLAPIRNAALLEFGSMGHMLDATMSLDRSGVYDGCKLYSTHLDEADISLGNTERFSSAIAEIIENDKPQAVFALPSTIPQMIGTDLKALCRELQQDYPEVQIIPFEGGGFNIELHRGIQETLLKLAKALVEKSELTKTPTFNIIGSCADLYKFEEDARELTRILDGAFGIKPLCIMTSDTSIEQIRNMSGAHINLVIRREGIEAAKYLEEQFGIPFIVGRPYGFEGTKAWLENISDKLGIGIDHQFLLEQFREWQHIGSLGGRVFGFRRENSKFSLGGHADVVQGIIHFARDEMGMAKNICWCDSRFMATEEVPFYSEENWSKAVSNEFKGLLMASGEVLKWAGQDLSMQIADDNSKWKLNPYEPPLVGFRGAINLTSLWINKVLG